jgi:hypothetical protein
VLAWNVYASDTSLREERRWCPDQSLHRGFQANDRFAGVIHWHQPLGIGMQVSGTMSVRHVWRIVRQNWRNLLERSERLEVAAEEGVRQPPIGSATAVDDAGVPKRLQRASDRAT